jgi:hypothetical protein
MRQTNVAVVLLVLHQEVHLTTEHRQPQVLEVILVQGVAPRVLIVIDMGPEVAVEVGTEEELQQV